MDYKPHGYQQYMIDKIIEQPRLGLFVDMGLGKTSATLTAIEKLIYEYFEISKVLVIAPLHVADATWEDEILKWNHLKHLRISKILGSEKKRIKALQSNADIYTINRDNVKWLIDYCLKIRKWPFDCLIIDESSSFKNHKAVRFERLKFMCDLKKGDELAISRVILLSGTPSPNGYQDLWAQIYLLDQGKSLGKNITAFRDRFAIVKPGVNGQRYYVLRPEAEEDIQNAIKHLAVGLKWQGNIKMPERIDNFITINLDPEELKMVKKLENDRIIRIIEEGKAEGHRVNTIVAKNALSLSGKMLQLANGASYIEEEDNGKYVVVHDKKLDALEEIIEENEGRNIMVFYNFKHDYDRLMKRFSKLKPRTLKDNQDIRDWNAGKIRLLLAHPASMAHGLNLQYGGSIIVWFTMTWNLEQYQQANARLFRQGQKDTVVIHHLIAKGTYDEDTKQSLVRKSLSQDDLMESIKARIHRIKEDISYD